MPGETTTVEFAATSTAPGAQTNTQHSSSTKRKKNKFVVKTLQRYQRSYRALLAENQYYRSKEAALFQTVAAAEHSLHYVGTILAWQQTEEGTDSDLQQKVAEALIDDLRAHELMSGLGGRGPRELTTVERCLHAAVTPERIQCVRAMSLQQLADKLSHMAQRISMLMRPQLPTQEGVTSTSLQEAVLEYNQFCLLLHIAHDTACLQLCLMNLDKKQEQQPDDGWWQQVANDLQLLPHQAERLTAGWDVFAEKRGPLVQRLQEVANKVHVLLQPLGPARPPACAAETSAAQSSGTHIDAPQQLDKCMSDVSSAEQLQQQLSDLSVRHLSDASLDVSLQEQVQRSGSSTTMSSSGSGLMLSTGGVAHHYPGALDFEQTDQLHEHLKELTLLTRQLRELGRNLVFLFINTTTEEQQAISIAHSWPWWPQPTIMCEHIAKQFKDFNKCCRPSLVCS